MRILAALALVTAALAVPTAAWAYGSEVSASSCNASGGYVTRPAGTDIVIRQGWSAATKKEDQDFIRLTSLKRTVFDGISYAGPGTVIESYCTVTGA